MTLLSCAVRVACVDHGTGERAVIGCVLTEMIASYDPKREPQPDPMPPMTAGWVTRVYVPS